MSKPYNSITTDELHRLSSITFDVLVEVKAERHRQDIKWGVDRDFPNSDYRETEFCREMADKVKERFKQRFKVVDWATILEEEFWEALAEAENDVELRKELIQVAAVCVAWIEAIDRRKQ